MLIYTNDRERRTARIDDTVRDEDEQVYVREVGHSMPGRVFHNLPARDIWTIHFVTAGSGLFSGETVRAGDGYLIPKGVPFSIDAGEDMEHYWMMCGGSKIPGLLADSGMELTRHRFSGAFFDQLIRDFELTVSAPLWGDYDLPFLMNSLFWKLLAVMKTRKTGESTRQKEYIRLAEAFIDSNYPDQISVEDIAAAAHVTSRYMYKLFKKNFGKAPLEVLTERRMECARYLLATTSLSIGEIAADVGYLNPSRFAMVFREKHGMPPGRWRYIHTEHTDY